MNCAIGGCEWPAIFVGIWEYPGASNFGSTQGYCERCWIDNDHSHIRKSLKDAVDVRHYESNLAEFNREWGIGNDT